ncbi:MAG: transcription antitermination factor NusB [Candidatus Pacebacteria bacterium]|nr:transcription antitermination factor NusB [Candidatus Paceibacterota bacterium]
MANRHLYRSIVLQTLFEWDIRNFVSYDVKESIQYNTSSFLSISSEVNEDVFTIFQDIKKKRVLIDEIIEKAAPDWTLAKMTIIDRNILRLGMYEMLFVDKEQVPAKVAINEAVELAKQFGGGKSGRFINGVIGAVYKELGEPGKDFKDKKSKTIPLEEMEIDQKGSAVVYSIDEHRIIRIGMVHDIFGYWTLAKGGIREGETTENGTIRAIKEETDWSISIEEKLGENEYIAYPPERGAVRKQVQYFLAASVYTKPTLDTESGGLDDVRWFELSEISDLNVYDDVSKMLLKAIKLIMEKHLIQEFDESDEEESEEKDTEQKKEQASDSDNSIEIDYTKLKITELQAAAKERGLSGYSALKKAELVELLSQ